MNIIEKTFSYVGLKAKDKISGSTGIITCVSFDLYGCIQVVMVPGKPNEKGEAGQGYWYDINRIQIMSKKPVMEMIDFTQKYPQLKDVQGPAEKPSHDPIPYY